MGQAVAGPAAGASQPALPGQQQVLEALQVLGRLPAHRQ
jgi:hypothetical protein